MKHILLISILLLFVHIELQGQCGTEPATTGVLMKVVTKSGAHGLTHSVGDKTYHPVTAIGQVHYAIIQSHHGNQGYDTWLQCRLDTGATPQQLINESALPELAYYHLYGKTYQGGLIFHMSPSGGGLVADTSDASSGFDWDAAKAYCNTLSVTVGSATYTDWKLPNKQELNEMYLNLKRNGFGGFANLYYWSSTEYDGLKGWAQHYPSGNYWVNPKHGTLDVRAVRPFVGTPAAPQYPTGTVHCNGTATTIVDVTNPTTGKIWMDRNLGATQVATSSTDTSSYGDLYQWGRAGDGHQCRTSATTTTLSSIDQPGHDDFILASSSPYDWRSPENTNLWGVSGINNPCPSGYRPPTDTELEAERVSWNTSNGAGALASPLKLPMAGFRFDSNGSLYDVGASGYYWSSTVSSTLSRSLFFGSTIALMLTSSRASGLAVRCLKD